MNDSALPDGQAVESFFRALVAELPDLRDPRGKRLDLSFVITGVIASQLCGAVNVSSIHRFITHRLPWLQQATGMLSARGPSRAHLPRLLSELNMSSLQALSDRYIGCDPAGWAAADGKTFRGASRESGRQAVVLVVDHETGLEIALNAADRR